MKRKLLFVLVLSLGLQVFGQENKPAKDTTDIYKKIENYSEKSKLTKLIHKWIFRSSEPVKKEKTKRKPNFIRYEGKIIRNIIIHSKDPFGYSVTDTTMSPENWMEKTGNKIHIKSKEMAIRNFLLLKENKPLDTFLIAESARLLRAQKYIREVSIKPQFVSTSKDSVDIIITSLDSWSLIPKVSISNSRIKIGVRERNILGTGHQVDADFYRRAEDGKGAFKAAYSVPNFKNTFINGSVGYETDYDGYFKKTVSIERAFYSSLTRLAGGLLLQEQFLKRPFPSTNDTIDFIDQNLRFFNHDYWIGRSFPIFKGNTISERSTNLILSTRALFVNYSKQPAPQYDDINFFSNEQLYLFSSSLATQQYVEDTFIFRDGITEDIPVGVVYSVTAGFQNKNEANRPYLGAQVFYGNYFNWGFLSTNCEVGTFFNGSKTEQTAYSFKSSYFSNLWDLGEKWKMRQFIKPQIILGVNRLNSVGDRLSLNKDPSFTGVYGELDKDDSGNIQGFDSSAIGTQKYVLALQTQFYSPWEFLGFRLNPYLNLTTGMLKGGENSYGTDTLYSAIGVGCVVRNDYLVFDSFQFSFTFYPKIPGQGDNIFKTNSFENDDFGFQNFQIGKPELVQYK